MPAPLENVNKVCGPVYKLALVDCRHKSRDFGHDVALAVHLSLDRAAQKGSHVERTGALAKEHVEGEIAAPLGVERADGGKSAPDVERITNASRHMVQCRLERERGSRRPKNSTSSA